MTRALLLALLLGGSWACGSGGGGVATCVQGATQTCACPGGHSGVQTCQADHSFGTCHCDDTSPSGEGDAGKSDAGTPPDTQTPEGPKFLSFGSNVNQLTDGDQVTFTAIVSAGADALAGGSLTSADGKVTYGAFASASEKDAYSITLSWGQINQDDDISFVTAQARVFVAQFFDSAGRKASKSASLLLTCGDDSACSGSCVNLQTNPENCGKCGTSCPEAGGQQSFCSLGACMVKQQVDALACSEVCQQYALHCSAACTFFDGAAANQAQVAWYGDAEANALSTSCDSVPAAMSSMLAFSYEFCCCK